MADYTVFGYATDAFFVTPEGNLILDSNFDASTDRLRYEINESDGGVLFEGDDGADEVGPGDQYAVKYDANGNYIAEGQVYLEESWTLTDGMGNTVTLYKVESGGVHSGWVADGPITPGTAYSYTGPNDVTTANSPRYDELVAPTDDPDNANTYQGGAYNDYQSSGAQNDTIYGYDGNDQIDGGAGNDNLYGGDGSDTIDGGSGDDYIAYGRGGDSVRGGDGNDIIDEDAGNPNYDYDDTIDAGAGNDSVYAGWGDDYIDGGTGHDELHGSEGNDTIHGGDGNDTIYGGDGQDQITGGTGSDLIYAGTGNDTVDGGADNDTIYGEDGNDLLTGGAGDDLIDGGSGDDTIDGGDGNDRIDGGTGSNTLTGGTGDDTFVQSQTAASTVTDFDTGDTDGDGVYNDQLDVSALRTTDGRPVSVFDVVVTDDGAGNAKLTFPEGETIILQGVSPAQMSSTQQLNAAGIPCFTTGTRIATAHGPVPVEALRVGDRVQTRDNGLRPIRWIGIRAIDQHNLATNPMLRPVHIAAGTFGNSRDLRLSAQHALALTTDDGCAQLVRAGHLARLNGGAVRVAQGVRAVTYHHLLLDSHDLILAEGVACESFYPGPWGLVSVGPQATRDLIRLMPGLRQTPVDRCYGPTAHPVARFGHLPPDVRDFAVAS